MAKGEGIERGGDARSTNVARYFLERAEVAIRKQEYSYERKKALSVFHRYVWKQVAVSDSLPALIAIAGEMHRIVDTETGTEVFRSAPGSLPF
ncbi:hypothetical protein GFC01_05915 [Desulfofundulus thermobenzoicus]|uniref:Uncharacterized protein n=1 Tax=Desulfofundulus thermobenzoicus TaxID=29376 RepID=A0A6N7IP47_9FIRM|nr:hypothetical protein [Desulfofundulus thermobenzoicus]MQL51805.1 hypothetical protein [Desulfofundulus thermobenzoicus]